MGIVLFLVIFGIVVIAHEFGHMLVAKINGIAVVEFTVGMGPALFKFKKGETTYSVRLFPIGGACVFEGEDGLSSGVVTEDKKPSEQLGEMLSAQKDAENNPDAEEAFVHNTDLGKKGSSFPEAKVGARIATLLAGPVFNFILAFVFSLFVVGSFGVDIPVVQEIIGDSAAEAAGMQSGDKILKLNNKKIHLYREVSFFSMLNNGNEVSVVYERDGKPYTTVLAPKLDAESGRYLMGFLGSGSYEKQGFLGTLKYSAFEVKYWIDTTVKSLEMLIKGRVSKDDVAGPVGMAKVVNEIYTESKPSGLYYIWLNMLNFAILLSANLGVLNLLPVPALDGGRLVFLFIEAVRRKPIPPEKEGMVHFAGFVLLMILMVVVMFNDISRIF